MDVGTPLRNAKEIGSALTVVDQMTALAIVANTREQLESLGPQDVLLRPALGKDITSASFDRFSEAFTLGYAAALAMADELASFSVSEAEYATWRARGSELCYGRAAHPVCPAEQPVTIFRRGA